MKKVYLVIFGSRHKELEFHYESVNYKVFADLDRANEYARGLAKELAYGNETKEQIGVDGSVIVEWVEKTKYFAYELSVFIQTLEFDEEVYAW